MGVVDPDAISVAILPDALLLALASYLLARAITWLSPGPLYRLSSFGILVMGVLLIFFSPSQGGAQAAIVVVFGLLTALYLWAEHRREQDRDDRVKQREDEARAHRDRLERQVFDLATSHNQLTEAVRSLPTEIERVIIDWGETRKDPPRHHSVKGTGRIQIRPSAKMTFTRSSTSQSETEAPPPTEHGP